MEIDLRGFFLVENLMEVENGARFGVGGVFGLYKRIKLFKMMPKLKRHERRFQCFKNRIDN